MRTYLAAVLALSVSSVHCTKTAAPRSEPPSEAVMVQAPPAAAAPPLPRKPSAWQALTPEAVHIAEAEYLVPKDSIVEMLESRPAPSTVVHTRTRTVALVHRETLVPLERMLRPSLGLAGLRIDPANATRTDQPFATHFEISSIDQPHDLRPFVPDDDSLVGDLSFSPDGRRIAVTLVRSDRIGLGIYDVEAGIVRESEEIGSLSAIWGRPCSWVGNEHLLCRRRTDQGAPPDVEVGPNVQELLSGAAPVRTHPNLLRDPNDDALFVHHATVELVHVSVTGEVSDPVVAPGLIPYHSTSPDGRYLLVERLEPPFPRIVPVERFSRDVLVYELGHPREPLHVLHEGARSTISTRGIPEGPRLYRWHSQQPAALLYVVRRTDPKGKPVDRLHQIEAPFRGPARVGPDAFVEVQGLEQTTEGTIVVLDRPSAGRRRLVRVDRRARSVAEGDPEDPRLGLDHAIRTDGSRGPILEHRGSIFIPDTVTTTRGSRPSLIMLDLGTGGTKTAFVSRSETHESVLAVLDARHSEFLISRESPTEPPHLITARHGAERAPVTASPPSSPVLRGIERRLLRYERADGVKLSAMLYLPRGHRGGRIPVVFWIYPREFSDEAYASQAVEATFRYFDVRGPSRFSVLEHGYALLDSPSMPIVGSRQSAQSSYVTQLVASARAAVDHLVAEGIADPDRIAVVGRSYGAFSAANLMAHSDLFRTAVAMSGAYNRTLTPFGFQNETRSFWQRQEAYVGMSPFFHADRVRRPILLIHGEADDNPGTPAMQSERFFAALAGNGVPVRYVSMPFEGHHYRARESVMHVLAELLRWLDRQLAQT